MSLIHVYSCDGPNCEEKISVEEIVSEGNTERWIVVSYIGDEEAEEEYHYCSWECLRQDAVILAEAEKAGGSLVKIANKIADNFKKVLFTPTQEKEGE